MTDRQTQYYTWEEAVAMASRNSAEICRSFKYIGQDGIRKKVGKCAVAEPENLPGVSDTVVPSPCGRGCGIELLLADCGFNLHIKDEEQQMHAGMRRELKKAAKQKDSA